MKKLLSVLSALAVVSATLAAFAPMSAFAAADTQPPSDVTELTAIAGDSYISLSWAVSTDDVGIGGYYIYYGLTSVKTEADHYTFDPINAGNVVKYDVKNLENGTTYYFTVVAYDTATPKNYSQNYSPEVSATPQVGLGSLTDVVAPTVVKAEAISKSEVKIEFSEKVKFSDAVEKAPEQAFTVENDDTLEALQVLTAKVMEDKDVEEGQEGRMVLLTTETQKKDAKYVLTARMDVEDLAGNSIVSGTSDTAPFVGSDLEPKAADTAAPEISKVTAESATIVLVKFNESVVLGLEPNKQFSIYLSGTTKEGALEIKSVVLGNDTSVGGLPNSQVLIETSEMQSGKTYKVEVTDVQDTAGNKISQDKNSAEFSFTGTGTNGNDNGETVEKPLVDAENFVGKLVQKDDVLSVVLSWTLPSGEVSTLQRIARSSDKGVTYTAEGEVAKDVASYTADKDLKVGDTVWFKLTQVDDKGNESKGVIAKIKLTETGPELIGLVLISLGLGSVFGKKKKK